LTPNNDPPFDISFDKRTESEFSSPNGDANSLCSGAAKVEIERLKKQLALAQSQNEKKDQQLSNVMCPPLLLLLQSSAAVISHFLSICCLFVPLRRAMQS